MRRKTGQSFGRYLWHRQLRCVSLTARLLFPGLALRTRVMNTEVTLLTSLPPPALPLESVERKGLSHPDTICDALADNLSCALSSLSGLKVRLIDPCLLPPRRARTGDIASARLAGVGTMWREVVDGALVTGED